ncbi:hypothetical protein D3C76_1751950 [compost metagenome]
MLESELTNLRQEEQKYRVQLFDYLGGERGPRFGGKNDRRCIVSSFADSPAPNGYDVP